VPGLEGAEDILQDDFFEPVLADRLKKALEQVGAWLYRVARNRITDLFRRPSATPVFDLDKDMSLEQILPAPGGGLEAALNELPADQRVFGARI